MWTPRPDEIRFAGDNRGLSDVAVFDGIRLPGVIGFHADEIRKRITIASDLFAGNVLIAPIAGRDTLEMVCPIHRTLQVDAHDKPIIRSLRT